MKEHVSKVRLAAIALTGAALLAGGLVAPGPALADHCDPAESGQSAGQAGQGQGAVGQDQQNQDRQAAGQDQQAAGQGQGQGAADQNAAGQGQGATGQDRQGAGQGQDATGQGQGQSGAGQDQSGAGQDRNLTGQGQNAAGQGQNVTGRGQGQAIFGKFKSLFRQGRNPAGPGQGSTGQGQNFGQGRDGTGQGQGTGQAPAPSATAGADDCVDLGPAPEDFIDIRRVRPVFTFPRFGRNGSRGTFISPCGNNENGHFNSDNFIVAPGVTNGAHHLHDYVGNVTTDAFSTDESLAAGGTTCRNGDKSTYFWPVLRDRTGQGPDAGRPGGGADGNVGRILRPLVTIQFRGNPHSKVVAMPRFLKMITGDAKALTNGPANARAQWTCTGFTNRITDKYPLCPRGSRVVRILDFPSCWDGVNTDSADHRTHVVFPDASGRCPAGTRAIPQLRITLVYRVPPGPAYALDSFPEQRHSPITDHGDFANVFPDRLMRIMVTCINRGLRC